MSEPNDQAKIDPPPVGDGEDPVGCCSYVRLFGGGPVERILMTQSSCFGYYGDAKNGYQVVGWTPGFDCQGRPIEKDRLII